MIPVKITDTSLGHMFQMLLNNRIKTEEFLHIIEKLDDVGFHSIELCEGSSFEISLRHLKEDPWERIKKIKSRVKKTKLQILLRGHSLNGSNFYSEDIVKYFIEKVAANGIDIIRVSDPLNDINNLETTIQAGKNQGLCVEGTIYYSESPVHNIDYFANVALQLEKMRVDSICIKDIQGLLGPFEAYELISALKKQNTVPIHLHVPNTKEAALSTYIKAIEAGVDGVDSSASVMYIESACSPLELLVNTLKKTTFDTKLDSALVSEISHSFHLLTQKHSPSIEVNHKLYAIKNKVSNQLTKGMISNLMHLLKQLDQEERLEEAVAEVLRVREDLGYPPLAAPISQIITVQAVLNLITSNRYKMVTEKVKDLANGKYGKLPIPVNNEIMNAIMTGESTRRDNLNFASKPSLDSVKEQVADNIRKEEDILTYAIFPHYAKELFELQQEESAASDEVEEDGIDEEDELSSGGKQGNESESSWSRKIMEENSSPSVLHIDG